MRLLTIFQASPRQLAQQALLKAQRALVSHGCQAEYHAAMATMYRERVQRLQQVVSSDRIEHVDARVQAVGVSR